MPNKPNTRNIYKTRLIFVGTCLTLFLSLPALCGNERFDRNLGKRLEFTRDDLAVASINMAFSCAIAAIRTGIRTNDIRQTFKSCGYGAIGGMLIYGGQKMSVYSGVYDGLGWAAQLTNSLGVSLRDNVGEGISPFGRFQHNLGPVRISIGSRKDNGGYLLQGKERKNKCPK